MNEKAIEITKRVQGFCKDNDWYNEKGGKLTVALHIDRILEELLKTKTENKRLAEKMITCHGN